MTNKIQNIPADSMYYVYVLIDPRNDQPFYVGKGKNKRVKLHFSPYHLKKDSPNPLKTNLINKLKALGLKPTWKILFKTFNESEAYKMEMYYIKKWGRRIFEENGILTNVESGGIKGRSGIGRSVSKFDMLGKFVCSFPSLQSAAESLNRNNSTAINLCCKKRKKSAYGFLWAYEGDAPDLEYSKRTKTGPKTSNIVYQWDLEGKFIKKYRSAWHAAAELGNPKANTEIRNSIKNQWIALGFRWTLTPKSPGKHNFHRRTKPVYKWSLDGNFIAKYSNSWEALASLGRTKGSEQIRSSIARNGTSYGFKWTDVPLIT
jgi:hypothetical protein